MARRPRRGARAAAPRARPAEPPAPARVAVGWWQWLVLVVLVLAVYAPSLRSEFVNWDDQIHVYENPRVTARDGLLRSWYEGREPGLYPVLYTTYWVEWRVGGQAPWLFHVDSALVHAGNTLLVGALVGALGLGAETAWLVAALWALHPVHVESVAWIAERKNVLYAFFWLAALLLWLRASEGRRAAYAGSLVAYALALLSKAAAITLPAAIVLVEWVRGRPLDRRLGWRLAPYLGLAVAGGLELLWLVPAKIEAPPLATRLGIAARAFWGYLAAFLWPHPLVPVYAKWSIAAPGAAELLALIAVSAVALAVAMLWRRIPRPILFGAGVFVINIFLVLGVVWNSYHRFAFLADRYLYVPAIGLALVAVVGLQGVARAAGVPARVVTVAIVMWAAVLGVLTWRQVPVWRDSETLWTYTLAHNPRCATCHLNLGNALAERGALDAAVEHYEQALAIERELKVLLAYAKARMRQERYDDAVSLLRRALRVDPDDADTHYTLANALRNQGKVEEAIAAYRDSLRLAPNASDTHNNLGVALLDAERPQEARAEFLETLRLRPGDVEAELNLGLIASQGENWPEAVARYRAVLARVGDEPRFAPAHYRLAIALARQGAREDAVAAYETAHRLMPEEEDVLDDLVLGLLGLGRFGDAVQRLEAARARTPDSATVAGSLAWLRATVPAAEWRNGEEAVRLAEEARGLADDEDADSLDTLAAAYAEAGRFPEAVRAARAALARAMPGSSLANDLQARLALYEAGRPFRMTPPDDDAAQPR